MNGSNIPGESRESTQLYSVNSTRQHVNSDLKLENSIFIHKNCHKVLQKIAISNSQSNISSLQVRKWLQFNRRILTYFRGSSSLGSIRFLMYDLLLLLPLNIIQQKNSLTYRKMLLKS